ncbi:hypothetical protein NSQ26_05905 [Bacillus sp. FSL W7-1360]
MFVDKRRTNDRIARLAHFEFCGKIDVYEWSFRFYFSEMIYGVLNREKGENMAEVKDMKTVDLGDLCDEWYRSISTKNFERSVLLAQEARELLKIAQSEDFDRRFFDLVNDQYDGMIRQINCSLEQSGVYDDDRITYFRRYQHAKNLFEQKHYKDALEMYERAEEKLHCIEEAHLVGEHYFRVGQVLYHMSKHSKARTYLDNAKGVFEDISLLNKVFDCLLLIGGIESERGEIDVANSIYEDLLIKSDAIPRYKGYIYQAKAQNFVRSQNEILAKEMYEKALNEDVFMGSPFAHTAMIELADLKYASESASIEAGKLKDHGWELAEKYSDREYELRARVLSCLHEEHNEEEVNRCIDELIERGFKFAAAEISSRVAEFYEKKGQEQFSMKYRGMAESLKEGSGEGDIA